MRKFKLIKKYPGSTKLETIVEQLPSKAFYVYYTTSITDERIQHSIFHTLVENEPEYWEEIKSDYTTEDGVEVNFRDTVHFVDLRKANCPLYDGSCPFCKAHLPMFGSWKIFSTKEAALKYIKDNTKTVFLKTEDGYDKYIGDEVYTVVINVDKPYLVKIEITDRWIRPANYLKDFHFRHNAEQCIRDNTKVEITMEELYKLGYKIDDKYLKIFELLLEKVKKKLGNS